MTMENFTFTGADEKKHGMKRFTALPARDAEKVLEVIPFLIGMEEGEDPDITAILPVLKIADTVMRSAFVGTQQKYEKAINDMPIFVKFELFGEWIADKEDLSKAKKD